MSKKVKKILGVVAAIAIPFAAPLIAGSAALAGVAGAIGTTATSALVGAGLGAANAAITGGNVAQGALLGGITSGAGQLFKAGQAVQGAAGLTGAPAAAATAAAPTATGLGGFVGNVAKGIGTAITTAAKDPNNWIRAGLNIAGELAAQKAAKLTPQEQRMFDALAQEQAWRMGISKEAYLANQDLFNQAYDIVKGISPEAEAQRYAASVSGFEPEELRKVRAATPTAQPGLLESRERELGIAQAERRATAAERGFEAGREAKMRGLAGLQYPGAPSTTAGEYPQYFSQLREGPMARASQAGKFYGGLGEIFFPGPRSEAPKEDQRVV